VSQLYIREEILLNNYVTRIFTLHSLHTTRMQS